MFGDSDDIRLAMRGDEIAREIGDEAVGAVAPSAARSPCCYD
jgi:hypothetical protein